MSKPTVASLQAQLDEMRERLEEAENAERDTRAREWRKYCLARRYGGTEQA